ncbi:MAG: E3 binding domain-containing protein, partial [Burkholderiaceae bacterium]|nr:E3 binding domain-containing protein [Burkholderiaceae bacterium]
MALIEVKVPDIGDFKEVQVIELLVQPGDRIKAEQSLITVESDKASMEIPSDQTGVVKEVKVAVGDKVGKGTSILVLESQAAAAAPSTEDAPAADKGAPPPAAATAEPPAATAAEPAAAVPAAPPAAVNGEATTASPPVQEAAAGALPHASPSIRKLARELGVPLAEVQGSGPKGRIMQADVQGFVKGVMAG